MRNVLRASSRVRRTAIAAWWPTRRCVYVLVCWSAFLFAPQPAAAQFLQQGPALSGNDIVGNSEQGVSVAVSQDGNTAIVGGNRDNTSFGAAWVYTRSGGVWTQQGTKLVGTGASGSFPEQGISVALSSDGNTALVGGFCDGSANTACGGSPTGAAWVFVRSGGVWTQQGDKLVGTTTSANAWQGYSVALSGDGNTAILGGPNDGSNAGAAWVFTRSAGVWTQQIKLQGTGASGSAFQGASVALSYDGNTALVGGTGDSSFAGATWVFTRSAGVWTQQGNKLVGTGATGNGLQGKSVALSGDGNTAMVGGSNDNTQVGAVWVFTRSAGTWTQQGSKLIGSGGTAFDNKGTSVALSPRGNTAVVGGPGSPPGAAWVFTRSGGAWTQLGSKLVGTGTGRQGASVALSCSTAVVGSNADVGDMRVFTAPPNGTHDLSGDCLSDIVWRDTSGNAAAWLMDGSAVSSSASLGMIPNSWSIVGQRDFNGDGKHDVLWRDSSGSLAMWFMNGTTVSSTAGLGTVPTSWSIAGTADFNGDGKGDLLWRDTGGNTAVWLMNGSSLSSSAAIGVIPAPWSVAGAADFDRNGKADILWRNTTTGDIAIWFMNGTAVTSSSILGSVPTSWSIVATGDFDGDGKADILWRDTGGTVAIWLINGSSVASSAGLGVLPSDWIVAQTGDFDGDGKADIVWRNTTTGDAAIWFMNGTAVSSTGGVGTVPTTWTIQGLNAN